MESSHKIQEGDKLYLVTRRDLSPGYQAVQSAHALRLFAEYWPEIDREWYEKSNYIAFLSVEDEEELEQLFINAAQTLRVAAFKEPDLDNEITAIAI